MDELYSNLQFWKNIGFYVGWSLAGLAGIVAAISFYKTSQVETQIRIETSKQDSIARNQFLERLDRQQLAFDEANKKAAENKTAPPEVKKKEPEITDNYNIKNDTVNKILRFWPKSGEWKKPIVAYPLNERDFVNGRLTSERGIMFSVMEGENKDKGVVFFVASGGPSATHDNPYGLTYDKLPSYILIGDDGIAMWRVNLK